MDLGVIAKSIVELGFKDAEILKKERKSATSDGVRGVKDTPVPLTQLISLKIRLPHTGTLLMSENADAISA
jgi:hypothetical protein